jgi:glycerol-3-phosphate acyltransferase PlsY
MSAVLVVAGFLLGAVPFGWIVHRLRTGGDLRLAGSGNIGATNVVRSVGLAAGLGVLALDLAKGAAPVLLARHLAAPRSAVVLVGVAAVLGHVFSPYLGFRGGKGVATSLGVFAVLAPVEAAVGVAVFAAVLAVTRYVSLSSLAGTLTVPVQLAVAGGPGAELWASVGLWLVVFWRHRDNLDRLWRGSEPHLSVAAEPDCRAGGGPAGGEP